MNLTQIEKIKELSDEKVYKLRDFAVEMIRVYKHAEAEIAEKYLPEDRRRIDIKKDIETWNDKLNLIDEIIEERALGRPIIIKQSRHWWQNKDLDWFIENAEFAFRSGRKSGYKEQRVWIKTKSRYMNNGSMWFNCFEFDVEGYGVLIKAETTFNESIKEDMIEVDYNAKRLFIRTLQNNGHFSVINPSFFTKLFNLKDKYIKI